MRNWRPPRAVGWLARTALPGLRSVQAQVAAYAAHWDEANRLILDDTGAEGGPLWVALGDSTAQGIGAPDPTRGYVGQLAATLKHRTGSTWRVLNLSRSGARVAEVLDVQLPRLDSLPAHPRLVTCAVGANDLVRRTEPWVLVDQMRLLMGRLPTGAILATLPQGLRAGTAAPLNEMIRSEAPGLGLVVADVWAATAGPWTGKLAADGFHPGTLGYADWARAFELALPSAVDG